MNRVEELRYFWYWRPADDFPPKTIQDPDERAESDRINIVCTQTDLSPHAQRKLVQRWCECLPELKGIRFVWLNSRVPQNLFDAVCLVPGLEGLYVKWSGVKNIEAVANAPALRYFHLGSSAGLESIQPLSQLRNLKWLGLENLKRISSFEEIGGLTQLEGLALQGSISTTQYVDSLEPIGHLKGLRYLSLVNLRSRDATLKPLFRLRKLEAFHSAAWWREEEEAELQRRNPRLIV